MNREATEVREVSPGYALKAAESVVPEGYKQTEVGVIPEHWRVAPLRQEVAKLEAGVSVNSVDKNLGSYSHEQSVLKTSSVADGRFYSDECKKIAPRDLSRVSLSPRADTLLISRMNTPDLVGECGYVDKDFPCLFLPDRLWMTQKHDNSKASFRWLSYLLSSKPQKSRIKGLATGTSGSMKNISKDSLLDTLLPFPPPEEQEAIATALSDVDALLEELDRLIGKKRDIKQAAMQQLLTGQTRLPGFEGEWEGKQLGQLGQFLKGSGVKRDEAQSGALSCVRYGEIYTLHDDIVREFNSWISEAVAETAVRIHKGDILFAGSGETKEEIGKCVAIASDIEAYAGGDIVILRSSTTDPKFLGYALNQPAISTQKARFGQGDAVVHISASSLSQITLRLPARAEQEAISSVLWDMDTEIEFLEQRQTKTAGLKKAMMQGLLTGRTRLIGSVDQKSRNDKSQAGKSRANVYFMRSVFAAEIVDQLHEEPTFGHVKLEKVLYLAEHLCDVDTGSTYRRKAAGPYDNRALRSIDSQLRKQKWFDARKEGRRYFYEPLQKRGGHQTYFNRYFSSVRGIFDRIIETLRGMDTERCEIVATLYAAWNDLLRENGDVSDQAIVHEVLNNWHESKKRISEDRWLRALGWMRDKGITPKRD